MAPIDLHPALETPPAYIRKADGLLVPDRKLIKSSYEAMLPGMIPGIGLVAGGASKAPFEVSYVGETWNTANAATYTFTNYQIGAASPDRTVLLAIAGRHNSSVLNINSVTLNNNAMTLVSVGRVASGQTLHQALYSITAPTGTTATIVVTWSGSMLHTHIACWRVISAGSIVGGGTGTGGFNSSSLTLTNTANAGSYIVGAAIFSTYYSGATWTNATRNYIRQDTSAEVSTFSGATKLVTTNGSHSITVANGGPGFGSAGASCIVKP